MTGCRRRHDDLRDADRQLLDRRRAHHRADPADADAPDQLARVEALAHEVLHEAAHDLHRAASCARGLKLGEGDAAPPSQLGMAHVGDDAHRFAKDS